MSQTSPHWRLIMLTHPTTPPHVSAMAVSFGDARITVTSVDGGFGRALNEGLRLAASPWLTLLLSDDRLDRRAIEVFRAKVEAAPEIDFFHSARRFIDAAGRYRGGVLAPDREVSRAAFTSFGSPVKHALCWRRDRALAIGGFDESLEAHGMDDFDFPWRMFEAGCRFRAVSECLYEYRVHLTAPRLTTGTPIDVQLDVLGRMFEKHGVPAATTTRYLERASRSYLVHDHHYDLEAEDERRATRITPFRYANAERAAEFSARGFAPAEFFAHRVLQLPTPGRGGVARARRMCRVADPGRMRRLVLYDLPPARELAEASLVVERDALVCLGLSSQLHVVGWSGLLLNAVLDVAVDLGLPVVRAPVAVDVSWLDVRRDGDWWLIRVSDNRDRIVRLAKGIDVSEAPRTICVCHDGGRLDPALDEMLAIERDCKVRATYHVVGRHFATVAPRIRADGHALAFNGFDHRTIGAGDMLRRWVQAVTGRPVRDDERAQLALHDVAWLASSARSLGHEAPSLINGVVRLPIHLDDRDLRTGRTRYPRWRRHLLELVRRQRFVAVTLHDRSADRWLPHYRELLHLLRDHGRLATLDEVAHEVALAHAGWT